MAPSTAAVGSTLPPGSAVTHASISLSVPEQTQQQREGGGGHQRRKQRAGGRHGFSKHGAKRGPADAAAHDAGAEQHEGTGGRRLRSIEVAERDAAKHEQQEGDGQCRQRQPRRPTAGRLRVTCRLPPPPRLPITHATSRHSTSRMPAGSRAPRITSCVLIMRSVRCMALLAMVWAVSMASPSGISTSDGGTTTPSVLARAMVACRVGTATPAAARAAPWCATGPARWHRPSHSSGRAARRRPKAGDQRRRRLARQQPCSGAKQCCRHGHAVQQHAHQHVERQRLQQVVLEQVDRSVRAAPKGETWARGRSQRRSRHRRRMRGSGRRRPAGPCRSG